MIKLKNLLKEDAIKAFSVELNDENIKAKIHTATGSGQTVDGQFTTKKWNDGVPVTKYLTRGGKKTITIPKGRFKMIETDKFWYLETKGGWAAISRKSYSTPPFEF